MICPNCGKTIPEGSVFCGECGSKLELQQNNAQTSLNNQQEVAPEVVEEVAPKTVETAPETVKTAPEGSFCSNCGAFMPKGSACCGACGQFIEEIPSKAMSVAEKKSVFKRFLSKIFTPKIIATTVAVVVGTAAVVTIYPYAANFCAKLFMNEEKYFEHIVKDNAGDYVESLGGMYGIAHDAFGDGMGASGKAELKLGGGFDELMEDVPNGDMLTSFDKMAVSYEANMKDSKANASVKFSVNGVDLGKYETMIDFGSGDIYLGLPDYNPKYMHISAGSMMAPMPSGSEEAFKTLEDIFKALPSEAAMEKMAKNYIKAIANSVEDVEETTETIEAGSVSQKVTALTVDLDGKLVVNAAKAAIEEMKKDKELKKSLQKLENAIDFDSQDFYDSLDDMLDSMDGAVDEDEKVGELTVYVNAKGEIVGFAIEAEEGGRFEALTAEKGGKFGIVVSYKQGMATFKIEGEGKVFADKYSGEFKVKANGLSLDLFEIKDVNAKLLKEGIFNGSIIFDIGDLVSSAASISGGSEALPVDLDDLVLTITSKSKSLKDQDVSVTLSKGKKDIVELSASEKLGKAKAIKAPGKYVTIESADDMEEWANGFDFSDLTKKLKKAKMPDEVIDAIEEAQDNL